MAANQLIDLLETQGLLDPEVIVEFASERRSVQDASHRRSLSQTAGRQRTTDPLPSNPFSGSSPGSDGDSEPGTEVVLEADSPAVSRPPQTTEEDTLLLPEDSAKTTGRVDANKGATDDASPHPPLPVPKSFLMSHRGELQTAVRLRLLPDRLSSRETRSNLRPKSERRSNQNVQQLQPLPRASRRSRSPSRTSKPVKLGGSRGNSWDAFRIWGVGFILSVLLAVLSWLVYWVLSGSSVKYYEQAVQAYESSDYEAAATRFANFAKNYSQEEKASTARTLAAISSIRHAGDQLGDPVEAIQRAEALLPTIVNESSMNDAGIRSDLASALVSVGEKLVQRADSAKTTDDRKKMIEHLDRQLVLIRNPQYIPNTNRVTNEIRIKSIEEERERILRDVQRAEDLVTSVAEMKKALEKSDVQAAYEARRSVVRKYPQLAIEQELLTLLEQATAIQQKAVSNSDARPQVVNTSETDSTSVGKRVLLYKRNGATANINADHLLCVKAKGSIYGVRGNDGSVLWRRNVGIEKVSEPIRVSTDPTSDCLVWLPTQRRLMRLAAQDGSSYGKLRFRGGCCFQRWREKQSTQLPKRAMFMRLISLPAKPNGVARSRSQSKSAWEVVQVNRPVTSWATIRICTFFPAMMGIARAFIILDMPRDDRRPAVYALGQLVIFQNVSAGRCEVKVLKATDEPGAPLELAQSSVIALKGQCRGSTQPGRTTTSSHDRLGRNLRLRCGTSQCW